MRADEGTILDSEPPPAREQFGFRRTVCGCAFCQAPCRHIPGSLDVAALERPCPPDTDAFAWSERHLRVLTDEPFPPRAPALQSNGHGHWLVDCTCAVHDAPPDG